MPFSQTSTLQTIFLSKIHGSQTILPGLAGTVAQLRVLKDASLSHEELISGLKAQIRSEGRQVAFPSVTPMILMDPKSCVFLFAIVVRLVVCVFFFRKLRQSVFFVLGSAVCMFVHPLTDRYPHIVILYVESWHPREYASLTWLPKHNDHHSKPKNRPTLSTREPRLATLLVLKDWFGWRVGWDTRVVGTGHHGSPQQIREENGTLEISSVVSFYWYFTGGGFFKH